MATIESIPLAEIIESPLNPRKTFDEGALRELADDIAQRGILQPVLVRPAADPTAEIGYELVFGARRFRAAQLAGLEEVPAMIRNLDDVQVLEVQIVENAKRADVHPLEEAEAYEALHEKHGHDVDEIAAKVGKSRAYVYGRLKLCALGTAGRQAYYDGKLTASTALYVARIPSEDLQAKAVEELAMQAELNGGEPLAARKASDLIQRHWMLNLSDAGWGLDDAKLVKVAGACTACPKRTGNQGSLFADIGSADVCTDPPCFRSKEDALWKRTAAAAKRKGHTVLSEKEAAEVLPYEWTHSPAWASGYISIDDPATEDPRRRTYRQLLGDEPKGLVIARHPHQRHVVYLLRRSETAQALEAAGVDLTAPERPAPAPAPPRERDPYDVAAERAQARAVTAIVAHVEENGLTGRDILLALAAGVEDDRWVYASLYERREWDDDTDIPATISSLSDAQLAGLVAERLIAEDIYEHSGEEAGPVLASMAEAAGVSLGALEEAALAEVQAERESDGAAEAEEAA